MTLAIEDPLYLAAGVVFLAIGGALLAARRRHPPAVALAIYVIGLGFLYATSGFGGEFRAQVVPAPLVWMAGFAAAGGLGALALLFPKPIPRSSRIDVLLAGGYGLAFTLVIVWFAHGGDLSSLTRARGATGLNAFLIWCSSYAIAAVSIGTGALLPLRARRLGANEVDAMRAIGVIAVALFLLSPGGPWPGLVAAARGELPPTWAVIVFATTIISNLLWLAATMGAQARRVRNLFLTLIALNLGLGAVHQLTGELVVQIGRLLSALFLTYAVLRGQIEGLDVKVRFAISKSTVATAFVAVFFVASEGAQIVFGQGNEWAGLFAAGALVFAIAPLQRAAERLAEKAVPRAAASLHASSAEVTYRDVVARLLADGTLSREDERLLAGLAADLGIDARRALELRETVEASLRTEVAP